MAGGIIGDDGKDSGAKAGKRGFVDDDCGLPLVLLIEKIAGPWRVDVVERDVFVCNSVTKKIAWRGKRKTGYEFAVGLAERFNSYEVAREFPPTLAGHGWTDHLHRSTLVEPSPPPPPPEPRATPLDLNWEPRK